MLSIVILLTSLAVIVFLSLVSRRVVVGLTYLFVRAGPVIVRLRILLGTLLGYGVLVSSSSSIGGVYPPPAACPITS